MRSLTLLIVFLAAGHDALAARQVRPEMSVPPTTYNTRLVGSGILGGVIGIVAGTAAIGIPLAHTLEPTDDGLSTPGFIIGFQLGQAVGIASGVHLASDRQGDYRKALLLSTAVAAVGIGLLWTDDFDAAFESRRSQVILVAVPVTQLIASIYAVRD